jgi:hypothetical protein
MELEASIVECKISESEVPDDNGSTTVPASKSTIDYQFFSKLK